MKKALSLGLYVIVPLTGKDWGFLPAFPAPDCYTQEIEDYGNVGNNVLAFAKTVMKEFAQYNNTLMFTAANELAQLDKTLGPVPAQSVEVCSRVPLIYSDVDTGGGAARKVVADYLTCALDSEADAVDAYGLNVYSWCDETYPGDGKADNFQYSPYKDIKEDFKDFSVPFIFSEFGCNLGVFKTKCPYPDGRTWPDVKHFLGEDMGQFMSGAVAFQWSMDKEEYGLTLSPGFLAGQEQKVYKKYHVNGTWNAKPSEVDQCSFVPSDVAPMEESHKRPACPGKDMWTKVQRQRGVDKVVDWSVLPPPATALIGNATLNISECSADPGPLGKLHFVKKHCLLTGRCMKREMHVEIKTNPSSTIAPDHCSTYPWQPRLVLKDTGFLAGFEFAFFLSCLQRAFSTKIQYPGTRLINRQILALLQVCHEN
ncbi:1 [Durusdinium trenchii]|uniref:1 n=1 Tax=Durusdinium trenchii TaxID=1381693 RepID=A0ABP0HTJ8_9DINO